MPTRVLVAEVRAPEEEQQGVVEDTSAGQAADREAEAGDESAEADGAGSGSTTEDAADVPAPQALVKIRGIGPAIERLLNASGITTWAQLAATEVSDLQAILDQAGPRYRVHDPSTWPEQAAELAAAN